MVTLPLLGLYRLITKYPILVVFIYLLPFTTTLFNEELIEEEVERTELVEEFAYDESIPGGSDDVQETNAIVSVLTEHATKVAYVPYVKSAFIRLFKLHCQWLIDRLV